MMNGKRNGNYAQTEKKDQYLLSMFFSQSLDNPSIDMFLRQRYGKSSNENDNDDEQTSLDRKVQPGALPRIVLWGVTLTISGLAIYIWNHTQRTDPTTFISLGDFLAQLYGK